MGDDRSRFLLPTSESAILNVYRDELLEADQLPLKAFAYTPCYRRESGGYRTEERGTIRGHQLNKVEMFQFVAPEGWEGTIDELRRKAEILLEKLGLPLSADAARRPGRQRFDAFAPASFRFCHDMA